MNTRSARCLKSCFRYQTWRRRSAACVHQRRGLSSDRPLPPNGPIQSSLPASYYRGGTSRGLIFHSRDLPSSREAWSSIFLGAIGSPDPNGRQLDGIGGGVSSLSKVCIVGPSSHPSADVDYTFAAIGVKDAVVDYSANCGNLTTAIGPFAYDSGIISREPTHPPENGSVPARVVRIHNTNTGKIIRSTFAVAPEAGEAYAAGDFAIDGVAGTGSRIRLDFLDPAGSRTGKLLPTGNPVDIFDGVRVSCVDAANPCVFVPASELDIDGTILPDETEKHPTLLARLERIRVQAAVAMGLCDRPEEVPPSVPKINIVSTPAADHRLLSGVVQRAEDVDLVARGISVGQPHRALPITVGLCIAAAANVEGSVVKELLRSSSTDGSLVVGHPTGKLSVSAKIVEGGGLEHATIFSTARRLMEGRIYWK